MLLAWPLLAAEVDDGKHRPSSVKGVEEAYLMPMFTF
jgi:hypothetical protein